MEKEHYKDMSGRPISLEKLCRYDPDWAASRIRHTREEIDKMRADIRELRKALTAHNGDDAYCKHDDWHILDRTAHYEED